MSIHLIRKAWIVNIVNYIIEHTTCTMNISGYVVKLFTDVFYVVTCVGSS